MKFVHPKDGTEYEVEIEDDMLGFASYLLDTTATDGSIQHMLRIELFPLPCNHELIDEMVKQMHIAAFTVLQEFGAGLDMSSAEVTPAQPGMAVPPSNKKH